MRLGTLEFIFAPRVRAQDRVTPPDRMAWAHPLLAELGGILGGERWMVVAGLAVALHRGEFYRGHGDIDIGVPMSSLGAVVARMRAAGFAFTRRLAMLHVSGRSRLEVHRHVRADAAIVQRSPRHLRFWRRAGRSIEPEPYIDVFPYIVTGDELVILEDGSRIPLQGPLWQSVRLTCGTAIPVETLVHVAYAKAAGTLTKDALDRRMLSQASAAAG